MTQKNRIFAVANLLTCASLALPACEIKKKPKDSTAVNAQSCKDKYQAYDSTKKLCVPPDLAFCVKHLGMVNGLTACEGANSQEDCDKIGKEKDRNYSWTGSKCVEPSVATGRGEIDHSIKITWQGHPSVQGASTDFKYIGTATFATASQDTHQINVFKKEGSRCDLRIYPDPQNRKKMLVKVKGPASTTCRGKILVINEKTSNYNISSFSVKIN